MPLRVPHAKAILVVMLLCLARPLVTPATAAEQSPPRFSISSVAEKTVTQLPAGPLYWRVENFPTLAQAQASVGPTSLAAEVAGRAWLFTLGAKGGSTTGASMVAEIGPVPPPASAPEYLLRINNTGGPPGATTPVHMHPGSETFYILTGELTQRTPLGVQHVEAGHSMAGRAPGMAMAVSSTGTGDLNALVMFVVDAAKPFSSPAKLE
jgi:quercetin dioxygenase-like cupin family protein